MKKILIIMAFATLTLFLYGCNTTDEVSVTLYIEGTQVGQAIQLNKGEKILAPCAQKEGYRLDGWYTSSDEGKTFDNKWIFDLDQVSEDLSLYAIWVPTN